MTHESRVKSTGPRVNPPTSVAQLSKVLFNAQHRLTVAAVFASPAKNALRYEEVAEKSGVSRSVAHKELQVLVRIGAVQRVETGRVVHYLATESAFWNFVRELLPADSLGVVPAS